MKILVLEDDILRIDTFKTKLKDQELTIVHHADDALKLLRENVYDVVFLDHDLDGGAYIKSDVYNTGATVARNMHTTLNTKSNIIIHSWNPAGAEFMENIMTTNGIKCYRFQFGIKYFNDILDHIILEDNRNKEKV